MRNLKNIVGGLLLVLAIFSLPGCGSDRDSTTSYDAVVTFLVTYNGTGSAVDIGAIDVDVDLPEGFDLATEADGVTLAAGVVSVADGMPADTLLASNYVPEALPAMGQLFTAVISPTGFAPGPFMTVTRRLAAGEALPDPADFAEVQFDVYDTTLAGPVLLDPLDYTLTIAVQQQVAAP